MKTQTYVTLSVNSAILFSSFSRISGRKLFRKSGIVSLNVRLVMRLKSLRIHQLLVHIFQFHLKWKKPPEYNCCAI